MSKPDNTITRREAMKRIALKSATIAMLPFALQSAVFGAEEEVIRYSSLADPNESIPVYADYSSYSSQAYSSQAYSSRYDGSGYTSPGSRYQSSYNSLGYGSYYYSYSSYYNSQAAYRSWSYDRYSSSYIRYSSYSYISSRYYFHANMLG